jgi:hypothetical protein
LKFIHAAVKKTALCLVSISIFASRLCWKNYVTIYWLALMRAGRHITNGFMQLRRDVGTMSRGWLFIFYSGGKLSIEQKNLSWSFINKSTAV